jgi:hypothetical protein
MNKLTEILTRAIYYGEKIPADIRMRSIGLPTQPTQGEFIELLENEVNAYIDELIDKSRPDMEKLIRAAIAEVIGEDETTPEPFIKWQNYSAESPTVSEHYRRKLRAEQRKRAGL